MGETYDFSGWATKNNLRCSDGRVILQDAFIGNDGQTVPLVWNHQHNDATNVLGHALLENRQEGVYAYCTFNDTPSGVNARSLVKHGDIESLSIFANNLVQQGSNVQHGVIREVSLVLAGANPGAYIDSILAHGESSDDSAIIYTGELIDANVLTHADKDEEEKDEKEEKKAPKDTEDDDDETIADVFETLNDKQKKAVYAIVGAAVEDAKGSKDDEKDDEEGEKKEMKHNVFDTDNRTNAAQVLSHSDYQQIFADAKRLGSLKDAVEQHVENGVLAHAVQNAAGQNVTYGIADIDYLFPDYKTLNNTPEFIKRDTDWVSVVMGGVHHTPFSRIKSVFANITMDEARAKGYIKGKLKKEEVFSLLKRTTDPQTIYKKQKLDRDDIIDITDFDVVSWIKGEMRIMLDEEIARAILIGDGRLTSDDDHISEDHIRPIWTDADLYVVKKDVTAGTTDADTAKNFIREAIKARKDYKGSGNPVLYTTEDMLTEMLLLEDTLGHALYPNEAALATKLRVSRIVTVPVMENQVKEGKTLMGIIVNLADYNVGADKGGAVSMFDDFDIDYNQQKYLIETRISGALTKPYSAIVLQKSGDDISEG